MRQVGGDVQGLGEAAVHAAYAARADEPDADGPAHGQGAADCRRPQRALHDAGGNIARAHLAGATAGVGEALQLGGI